MHIFFKQLHDCQLLQQKRSRRIGSNVHFKYVHSYTINTSIYYHVPLFLNHYPLLPTFQLQYGVYRNPNIVHKSPRPGQRKQYTCRNQNEISNVSRNLYKKFDINTQTQNRQVGTYYNNLFTVLHIARNNYTKNYARMQHS